VKAVDRLRNEAEKAKGLVKEKLGAASQDHSTQAKGRAEQAKADLKQASGKVKDAVRR
jgi:uncharacterized protein YjbJ (UPF0337 family)